MTGSAVGSLLAFAAVVALIPLALWLLKRTPLGGTAAHGLMRVVAMLPVGTNQRLLTVEVGHGDERRWLVLGVSPAGIATLHTMAPQTTGDEAPSTLPSQTMPFSQVMALLRRGPGSPRPESDRAP